MSDRAAPRSTGAFGREPPILTGKNYAAASVFEPHAMLREARRQKGLPSRDVPAFCVLDPDGDIVRWLRRTHAARPSPGWACYHTELFEFELGGSTFGIVGCAVGASFAVLVAEQLFASGCQFLVSITSAGQVLEASQPPYIVVIDRALRDEGTSYHYLPPAEFAVADPALIDSVEWAVREATDIAVYRGSSWTTDAPFRETAVAIATARERGILAVEMEAAALYAFARAKRKPVLCLAHVTNTMGQIAGDFEKGEADGAATALRIIAASGRAWRGHASSNDGTTADPPARECAMIQAREHLFRRFEELGIVAPSVPYPAHQSVEEGKALRGQMMGTFTKNLLLKDKKGRLFLVAAEEDRPIDMKTLHKRFGGSGQLSFAAPEQVRAVLGIEPGALTPFALINDTDGLVTVVIDAELMEVEQINFHPLVQTESIGIRPRDLLRFVESCGRKPLLIDFGAGS